MRRLLLTAALVLAAAPASAFDCAKATTAVERAICADPALKAADDAMSAAYAEARARLDAAGQKALRSMQLDWIRLRDGRCSGWDGATAPDAACLGREIADRTALLTAAPLRAGPGAPRFTPVFQRRTDAKAEIDVALAYPQVADPSTAALRALNARLAEPAVGGSPEIDEAALEGPYTRSLAYRIGYASGRLVSVRFEGYEYTGGAHGMSFTSGVNFLLQAGRMMATGDLIDPARLPALTAYCRARLTAEKRAREVPEELIADSLNDEAVNTGLTAVDAWSFDDQGAAVHYDPYVLGAYAEGGYDCAIPWADLRPLLKPDAPLPFD
ncbi:lysozyme inhibitor LprI family protein [Zavarzinia compransoris]|nr:lysozyme inhibitor LprI family protein [Zavarzinia compransoris]TDP46848.1 uncharacterized protein DUF3298 [Zavarzinia compransoris]